MCQLFRDYCSRIRVIALKLLAIHNYLSVMLRASMEPLAFCCSNVPKWRRGVVVITTAQLHSTNPKLRLCAGSNPARDVSEIRDGENL